MNDCVQLKLITVGFVIVSVLAVVIIVAAMDV
jgi:hypothetical protein